MKLSKWYFTSVNFQLPLFIGRFLVACYSLGTFLQALFIGHFSFGTFCWVIYIGHFSSRNFIKKNKPFFIRQVYIMNFSSCILIWYVSSAFFHCKLFNGQCSLCIFHCSLFIRLIWSANVHWAFIIKYFHQAYSTNVHCHFLSSTFHQAISLIKALTLFPLSDFNEGETYHWQIIKFCKC